MQINNVTEGFKCHVGDEIPVWDDDKEPIRNAVCQDLPLYKELKGKKYCVLHYPKADKVEDFRQIFDNRIEREDYNFRGVWFPNRVDLSGKTFNKKLLFQNSTFNSNVNMSECIFNELVSFRSAKFLSLVSFNKSTFYEKVTFWSASFQDRTQIHFSETSFKKELDFGFATIKGIVHFVGYEKYDTSTNKKVFDTNVKVDFFKMIIENPEKIFFNSIWLHPHWFINVDPRKFVFTETYWENVNSYSTKNNTKAELKSLEDRGVRNSKPLFKIVCRQLSENAENNNRFEEASNFRRMAFETEWLEKKEKISNWINNLVPENEKLKRRIGGSTDEEDKPNPPTTSFGVLRRSGDFIIHGLYRITSFYGESWSWAAFVLLTLILIIFPFIYTRTDFYVCPIEKTNSQNTSDCVTRTLSFGEGVRQSLATATLQNVESRKPNSPASETFTILEKIFAPLQAALLALAIRRKFMR